MRLVAERIAGLRFFEFRDGGDIAGKNLWDRNLSFSLKQNDGTEPFRHSLVGVVRLQFGRQCSGVDTEQRYAARERIGKRLEDEGGKRIIVGDLALDFLAVRVLAGHGSA